MSTRVVHLGVFVSAHNSKTIGAIDMIYLHKKGSRNIPEARP